LKEGKRDAARRLACQVEEPAGHPERRAHTDAELRRADAPQLGKSISR